MCHVTLDHGGVQGGTCPKRVASPYILQRSRNLHSWSQFSSKHLPQICAWLGRSPHRSISSLLTLFPPAWLLPLSQPTWFLFSKPRVISLHSRPHGGPGPVLHPSGHMAASSLSAHSYFKCSVWNFLCNLKSSPSYDVLLLLVHPHLLHPFSCHL